MGIQGKDHYCNFLILLKNLKKWVDPLHIDLVYSVALTSLTIIILFYRFLPTLTRQNLLQALDKAGLEPLDATVDSASDITCKVD